MTEHPILFSDAMVQAILDGRKTQTRRVVKPAPQRVEAHNERIGTLDDGRPMTVHCPAGWRWRDTYAADGVDFGAALRARCPYGAPGDRLWVREAWRWHHASPGRNGIEYRASIPGVSRVEEFAVDWVPRSPQPTSGFRPSIHMPRWASRLTLEVVSVRVERLQAISEEDARAEGVILPAQADSHRHAFAALWDSINADRAPWVSNPWVWVVEFRRVST